MDLNLPESSYRERNRLRGTSVAHFFVLISVNLARQGSLTAACHQGSRSSFSLLAAAAIQSFLFCAFIENKHLVDTVTANLTFSNPTVNIINQGLPPDLHVWGPSNPPSSSSLLGTSQTNFCSKYPSSTAKMICLFTKPVKYIHIVQHLYMEILNDVSHQSHLRLHPTP